jgi:uncharacterized FlaG/YvyC family protein
MKVQAQTNPQNSKGMEAFLTAPSPSSKETKPTQKTTIETKPVTQVETKPTQKTTIKDDRFEEIEQEIKSLEDKLQKTKTLEFSQFNEIVHEKKLQFKLLFATNKLYILVMNNEGKKAILSVTTPRWGGSGLRYLLQQCASQWCITTTKKTQKGEVITYKPLTQSPGDDIIDDDDIFD